MAKLPDHQKVWKSFSKALGADFREYSVIRGVSGIDHPVQAIAVDDKAKRLIVVSAEPSPRIAALMQVDVQATMPDTKVIVSRPVLFDVPELSRRVFFTASTENFTYDAFKGLFATFDSLPDKERSDFSERILEPVLGPLIDTAKKTGLPFTSQMIGLVQQLANMDWNAHLGNEPSFAGAVSAFVSTMGIDNTEADRALGICAIPLYEFTETDWELLLSGRRHAAIRERLKELGIYQYFFPAPDHLLMGLADEHVSLNGSVVAAVEKAPQVGHPLGQSEMFPDAKSVVDVLEELKGVGYVAEAEFGVAITPEGREVRQTVKVRPREGLIQKLSRIISVKLNVDTKDFVR